MACGSDEDALYRIIELPLGGERSRRWCRRDRGRVIVGQLERGQGATCEGSGFGSSRRCEHPRAPGHLIALEAVQSLTHNDPGLGDDVLVDLARDDAQVPLQGRVDVAPQAGERRLVTALRAVQDVAEITTDHASDYWQGWPRPAADQMTNQPIDTINKPNGNINRPIGRCPGRNGALGGSAITRMGS